VGSGDPAGVAITHAMTSGMGGIRTTGDLVARMQISRGMKIDAAKKYVADKLGVSIRDMHDAVAMRETREDLKIGVIQSLPGFPKGMEAKHNISSLLDIEFNAIRSSRARMGL
jgi:dimethylamine---corrinoid protein Co-methyltransferase